MQNVEVGKIDFDLTFDEVLFIWVDDLKLKREIDFWTGDTLGLLIFSDNERDVAGKERVNVKIPFLSDEVNRLYGRFCDANVFFENLLSVNFVKLIKSDLKKSVLD